MKKTELLCDPFGERVPVELHRDIHLLGAQVRFESDSEELLRLVDSAYGGLPRHRLLRAVPRLRVRLVLTRPGRKLARAEPPPLQMISGASLVGAASESSSFMVVSPENRTALVAVAPWMLRYPYHARYELIEFAVYTLVTRVLGLVPLHGACVGNGGRGVLLLGPSGAGKSTVTLQCLFDGLGFLAEDSVFVTPDTLRATGVSNFLHLHAESLRWLAPGRIAQKIRKSPVIVRRSGARKYEIDLRGGEFQLLERPLKIGAIVFLSARRVAQQGSLLERLPRAQGLRMLVQEQAYAANQPSWPTFIRRVAQLAFFELHRGQHPSEAVAVLRRLIESPSQAARERRRA